MPQCLRATPPLPQKESLNGAFHTAASDSRHSTVVEGTRERKRDEPARVFEKKRFPAAAATACYLNSLLHQLVRFIGRIKSLIDFTSMFLKKHWWSLYQQQRRQACTARVMLLYDMPLVWCSIISIKGQTATHTPTHTFIFYLCLDIHWNNPLPSSYPDHSTLKPFLKPQPFEFMGTSQNGSILKECPHFVSRLSILKSMFSKYIDCHTYLHSEESNAGQQVDSGLEILETFWITCREIILREKRERMTIIEKLGVKAIF